MLKMRLYKPREVLLLVLLILLILTSGCVNKQEGGPTSTDKEPEVIQTPSPTVAPTDDTEIMKQKLAGMAKENLSQILNVKAEDIKVVNIEKTSWTNSSIGYGNPNESYLPVEVRGYKIFLQYKETTYEYHAGNERVVPPPDISQLPKKLYIFSKD
jgi:hypothetical protein